MGEENNRCLLLNDKLIFVVVGFNITNNNNMFPL
jgi:hypothetical protein